jgi:hypothetical protein
MELKIKTNGRVPASITRPQPKQPPRVMPNQPKRPPVPKQQKAVEPTPHDMEIDLEKYDYTCYIVGGGPSLKDFDWNLLDSSKFVIAINNTHLKLPEANIIYCTDPPWISPNAPTLKAHKAPVWQGVLKLNNPPKLPCVDKQWLLTGRDGIETRAGCMKHGSNSAYAATNLAAVHLGFKKIYLLGIDMKWGQKGKKHTSHWHSDDKPHQRIDGEAIYTTMRNNFKTLKKPLQQMGVEVINVNTPDGTDLETFPIKSREEVFGL